MAYAETVSLDPMIAGGPPPMQLSTTSVRMPDAVPQGRGRREAKATRRPTASPGRPRRAVALPTESLPPPPPIPPPTPLDIRVRAYEVYLGRGDAPGDALSDWLQAERELWAEHHGAEAARSAAAG